MTHANPALVPIGPDPDECEARRRALAALVTRCENGLPLYVRAPARYRAREPWWAWVVGVLVVVGYCVLVRLVY